MSLAELRFRFRFTFAAVAVWVIVGMPVMEVAVVIGAIETMVPAWPLA